MAQGAGRDHVGHHRGVDGAGGDRVDPDAVGPVLLGRALGQADDGVLGGVVRGAAGSADVLRGELREFQAIIAAVIGGVLLTGGYGSVIGPMFGALIFGMVSQGIFFTGVNTDWFQVFVGAMLLGTVLFNNFVRRRASEARL
jgi:predicted ABC-type sugar transport system permease subunit